MIYYDTFNLSEILNQIQSRYATMGVVSRLTQAKEYKIQGSRLQTPVCGSHVRMHHPKGTRDSSLAT